MTPRIAEATVTVLKPNPDLVKALNEPIRVAILNVMAEEEPISPVEVTRRLGGKLPSVSYHMRVLHDDCGLVEATHTRPRRGSVEHFYRRTDRMRKWVENLPPGSLSLPTQSRSGRER